MTLSGLRMRYLRPNIIVTVQKVQSNGHPRLVMIGVSRMRSEPTIKERSGIGSESRSAQRSRSSLCTGSPSRQKDSPLTVSSSRSPRSASRSSSMRPSPPSPRAT